MKLSVRLWRAIARHIRFWDDDAAQSLTAKILYYAVGKRHMQIDIPITADERAIVQRCFDETREDYFAFLLNHERETNPHFT